MHSSDTLMHGHHDPALVFLSIVIAVFASYTALDLAGRIKTADGRMRLRWLSAGAIALGGGIWSMHFVAMLAFSLNMPIEYDVALTALSLLAAIAVVGIGLYIVSRRNGRTLDIVAAGIFAGFGIATMHYTGMAAMRMNAIITYDRTLFVLSIVIAVVAAIVALWLAFHLKRAWEKIAAGFVMGGAIAGMHYTGMAAARFTPFAHHVQAGTPGETIPLLATVIAVATFGVLLLGLLSSTADRKLAAQAKRETDSLRSGERHFRAAIDTAHDAFVALNASGRIKSWNTQAENMFGWMAGEAVGQKLGDLIFPVHSREEIRQRFRDFLESGESSTAIRRAELVAMRRDGREFPVEVSISAIRIDGRTTVNAFIDDISNRKHAEAELIAARDQAQEASRAKSAFLANMSHELRTPLNAIMGFSALLRQGLTGPDSEARRREYAADIFHSGQRLLDLINDILDFSNAEQGQLELREEVFEISEAIAMSAGVARQMAQDGGIEFSVVAPEKLPRLFADPRRVRQILVNLLSNALKFTPRGGRVRLHAGLTLADDLVFTVEDTGPGMTAAQIKVALSPFGQVDNRLARNFGGAGLGLPLTLRLANLHEATLDIAGSETGGARVTVRFPAQRIRRVVESGLEDKSA